jgi:hypothetical protein
VFSFFFFFFYSRCPHADQLLANALQVWGIANRSKRYRHVANVLGIVQIFTAVVVGSNLLMFAGGLTVFLYLSWLAFHVRGCLTSVTVCGCGSVLTAAATTGLRTVLAVPTGALSDRRRLYMARSVVPETRRCTARCGFRSCAGSSVRTTDWCVVFVILLLSLVCFHSKSSHGLALVLTPSQKYVFRRRPIMPFGVGLSWTRLLSTTIDCCLASAGYSCYSWLSCSCRSTLAPGRYRTIV